MHHCHVTLSPPVQLSVKIRESGTSELFLDTRDLIINSVTHKINGPDLPFKFSDEHKVCVKHMLDTPRACSDLITVEITYEPACVSTSPEMLCTLRHQQIASIRGLMQGKQQETHHQHWPTIMQGSGFCTGPWHQASDRFW